jgi:plasmid stabilization system protein ParE
MTLLWSPESIHDLIALRTHIAEHDPAAAKRVALHILSIALRTRCRKIRSSVRRVASPGHANW